MKRPFFTTIAGLIMLGLAAGAARAATVSIEPSANDVSAGDPLFLSVFGADFTDNADGGTFSVTWDPNVLSYVSIAFVDPPWDTASVDESAAASGSLESVSVATTITGGVGPDFGIALITFEVVGTFPDTTTVTAADAFGGWVAPGTMPIDVTYIGADVSVVPIPAAVWLFGSALLGLAGIARIGKTT